MSGPYAGFDSIEEAVEGLRRGRFQVVRTFVTETTGFVVEGDVVEGTVRNGMVLLPVLAHHANIYTPLTIDAVEYVLHPGGVEHVGLVVQTPSEHQPPNLSPGTVLDVLERSPAA
jgi:hypothetical protein